MTLSLATAPDFDDITTIGVPATELEHNIAAVLTQAIPPRRHAHNRRVGRVVHRPTRHPHPR
ncbi:hypothetical protein RhoBH5_31520 [Rhodococcus sp. BH5]|nr:hypothetical protein [Rhodococcus sp. BH5]